jgi:hypothetical protein
MDVVLDAANRQGLHPMFPGDSAHEWPEPLLQRRRNQLASASRAEGTMKQGVDKCVWQGSTSFQSSLRDGQCDRRIPFPSDESLGYFQPTLRVEKPQSKSLIGDLVPEGHSEIARQFTAGKARHKTYSTSRRDDRRSDHESVSIVPTGRTIRCGHIFPQR